MTTNQDPRAYLSRLSSHGLVAVASVALTLFSMAEFRSPDSSQRTASADEIARPIGHIGTSTRDQLNHDTSVPDARSVFKGRDSPPEDPVPTF